MRSFFAFVAIVSCAISCGLSDAQEAPPAQTPSSTPEVTATPEATAQPHPSWLSPDQKWEYRSSGDNAKMVKAGTDQVVLDFSDESYFGCDEATLSWASDSKRFALNYGRGRNHLTALYQLRGDQWKALKPPNDDVEKILNKSVKSGSPKKTHLRLIWETVKVHQWVDSNTVILYGGLEVDEAFGAHFLVTLKFDEAGNWKIIKTQRLSLKEAEKL
jgi:hypothetical protein